VNVVLADQERLELLTKRDFAGESTVYCVKLLYNFVVSRNCKTLLELGVRSGVSTRAFLLGCKVTGGHLWSVDISEIRVPNIHFGDDWGLSEFWTFTQHMNDLDYEWDKPLDLLFIDTSHTYEQTLAELNKFTPYVKRNGIVLLHDSLLDGVEGWGVLRAIKTFLSENPHWDYYETKVEGELGVLTRTHPFALLYGEQK